MGKSVSGVLTPPTPPLPHLPTGMRGILFRITRTFLSFPANDLYEAGPTAPPFNCFSRDRFIAALVGIPRLFPLVKFTTFSLLLGAFSLL